MNISFRVTFHGVKFGKKLKVSSVKFIKKTRFGTVEVRSSKILRLIQNRKRNVTKILLISLLLLLFNNNNFFGSEYIIGKLN